MELQGHKPKVNGVAPGRQVGKTSIRDRHFAFGF